MTDVTSWSERFVEDMKLHDYRPRTQEAYLLAAWCCAEGQGRPGRRIPAGSPGRPRRHGPR